MERNKKGVKKMEKEENEKGCPVGTLKEVEAWEKYEREWIEEASE